MADNAPQLPRGIRNNNPGNLRWGEHWRGLLPAYQRTDPEFCQFIDARYGLRALARLLHTYDGRGLHTPRQIATMYAPPSENNTEAYAAALAEECHVGVDDALNMHDPAVIEALMRGIIRHENGAGIFHGGTDWYTSAEIQAGIAAAQDGEP